MVPPILTRRLCNPCLLGLLAQGKRDVSERSLWEHGDLPAVIAHPSKRGPARMFDIAPKILVGTKCRIPMKI